MLFDDPAAVGNLISGSSAFSKSSLNIWKFIAHVLLKPGLENFEHYLSREFLIQYDLIQYESSSSFKKKTETGSMQKEEGVLLMITDTSAQ